MQRTIPDLKLAEIEGYAKSLARGWDTIKETFNIIFPDRVFDQLLQCRTDGYSEVGDRMDVMVTFGGETMKLSPYGTRSALYVLGNDDFTIFLRSPKMEWAVSVEYRAAGLWEYGFEALRERVMKCLLAEGIPTVHKKSLSSDINDPKTWQRVTVAHFAFDFYSPEFSKDMGNPDILSRIVCPSATSKCENFTIEGSAYGSGTNFETITIGKKNTLQLQIYNKGKEITAVSGKTWMFKVWEEEGYFPPEDQKAKDVWRVELRFGGEFLKNRGILTVFDLYEGLSALMTEAIFTRRLTVASVTDSNRWRWALHPLFVAVYREIGSEKVMLPLGRQQTESHEAKADRILANIAGNLRAITVLSVGDMDDLSAWEYVLKAYDVLLSDPDAERKNEKVRNKYFFEREAA